jgi:hypothetical protein
MQTFDDLPMGEQGHYNLEIVRRGRVRPRVGQGAESRALVGDGLEGAQKIEGRTGESVEPSDHEHVTGVEMR